MLPRILLSGLWLVAAASAAAVPLSLVTDDNPPYSMRSGKDGETGGLSVDLVKSAFARAEISYQIRIFPWARALSMAQNNSLTCAFTAARTAQREPLFKWVGPYIDDVWALFGTDDSPPLSSLQEASGKVIGSNFGLAVSGYLAQQGLTVEEAGDDYAINARKLAAHRIDYWLSNETMQHYYAEKTGSAPFKKVLAVRHEQGYLACNRSVPDDLVAKLNLIFALMLQDGSAAAIRQRYQ